MEELQVFMEVAKRLRHLIQSQTVELKHLRQRVEELESQRNDYLQRCFQH